MPGIWFPFGIGVSRTQYAYAIAIPLLALLIVRTLDLKSVGREQLLEEVPPPLNTVGQS